MTPAGDRDRKVQFQRVTSTLSGLGTVEDSSWMLLEAAWAKVLFGTGTERRQAGAEGAAQTATFRVLSTPVLRIATERDRILYDGRAWDIVSISPIGGEACEIEFVATVTKG